MELVNGQPLTQFCDEHELGVAARLRLFRRICDGMHHAHTNGVIHRDLKPDNIHVTESEGGATPPNIYLRRVPAWISTRPGSEPGSFADRTRLRP